MKSKPLSIQHLTAEEASAVGGGLIPCVVPDMFWRYPLPHPIAPMPPRSIPELPIPLRMSLGGYIPSAQ